jgi:arylsulfatase A-like enzyme
MVDQLRGDYLDRYRAEWSGGFKRILEQGAFYPDGRQNHALTETAPGHATVLSGRLPVHNGIAMNSRGVQDPGAPLLESTGAGASPRRFQGTALFDWIAARDSDARVLSLSRKDRSAILPVGRARGQVYWYSDPIFTTSRYYADTLPAWVEEWNARRGAARLAGTSWDLLRAAASYSEPDSQAFENGGRNLVFPHRFPADSVAAEHAVTATPWIDSLTMDLALDGARALRLGQRGATDLLVISLSATDAVGHAYGPQSRELHDMLLRLDHWLGWFLDSLATMVPPGTTVFALAADHGVQAFPEWTQQVEHRPAGRLWLGDLVREVRGRLNAQYHSTFGLDFEGGLVMANVGELKAHGVNVDSLAAALAAEAGRRAGVLRVFTQAGLRAAAADSTTEIWRHTVAPDGDWLIAATLQPEYQWDESPGSTTHGSTNWHDVNIPIVLWGAGVRPGRYERLVNSVDIAPTLARLAGVTPSEPLDGVVLQEAVPAARGH